MLNSFLTSSQRQLVPLLLGAGRSLSVLDLSNLAKLPYSTTHTSLESLKQSNLVTSENKGRKVLYSLNQSDPDTRTLLNLLSKNLPQPSFQLSKNVMDEDVLWNLSGLGAPLVLESKKRLPLSTEETVALSLKVARKNPTVARVLPLVLAAHLHRLNYPLLCFLVKEEGETQTLGFFLELTSSLSGSVKLKKMAQQLLDRRVKHTEPFFKAATSKYEVMLGNLKTPKLARKWNFTMNMDMSSFRSFFEKHSDGSKKV